jgi:type II secretory pathway pseudopilin PulG
MRLTPEKGGPGSAAFTLFEVCIAIFIAIMIIVAAVPSLTGVLADQRAKKLFNQFNDLTREASLRASTERRPYVIAWDDSGVTLRPQAPANRAEAGGIDRVEFGERLAPDLQLPAALEKNPPREWTFWPTGTCEPATIICRLENAPWTATYDPLTEQPTFSSP